MNFIKNLYIVVSLYFIASILFEKEFDYIGLKKPLDFINQEGGLFRSPIFNSPSYDPTPKFFEHVVPSFAPNGSKWPVNAGYIQGYQHLNNTGYSSLKIDNTRGMGQVMVKLVYHARNSVYPVRVLYIPRGEFFVLNNINSGKYDVRYTILETGEIFKSLPIYLEEKVVGNRIQFSNHRMTLYGVPNGNSPRTKIGPSEF